MKYITRMITTKEATATLYDGENIVTQVIDVTVCRDNEKVIKKYIEKETNMVVLKFDIRQEATLFRMSIEDFIRNAEMVE